jgi:hypothetical protein
MFRQMYSNLETFFLNNSAIGFQDLSSELQKEVIDLQKRMAVELQPLVLESTLTMQKILECPDHSSRLQLVRHFVEAEAKRLKTKKAIKSMFSGEATGKETIIENLSSIPPEEQISESASTIAESTGASKSFFSDDDAFQ